MKQLRPSVFLIILLIVFSNCSSQAQSKKSKREKHTYVVLETNMGNMKIELSNKTPLHRDNFIKLVQEKYYDSVLFHRVINEFMIQTGDPNSKHAKAGEMLGTGGPTYTIPAEFDSSLYHVKGALAAARQPDQMNPQKKSSGSQFYIVHGKKYIKQDLTIDQGKLLNHFKDYVRLPENKHLLRQVIDYQNKGLVDSLNYILNTYADTISIKYKVDLKKEYPEDRAEAYSTLGGTPHLDDNYTVFGKVIEGLDIIDKIAVEKTDARDRPIKDIRIIKAYITKK